ncbi:replication initiation factor domain-containing protein [Streptococcus suis]|uniref:replication initiation factor domain-containing protein n=1 Tax=Streptococcus suis TaxID=1307 RepID=UPI0038BAA9CF
MTYEIEVILNNNNERKTVIMTSVDEITFVIKPTEDTVGDYPDNWHQIASTLSEIIANKLSLPILFGNYIPLKTPPAGYTDGFTFQDLPYYFAIAWHQTNFTMAQLLDEDYYELRLSRIDFAVDYFNYKLTVNDLYQGLKTKQYIITNNKGRKNISKISAQEVNGYAQTVYIGSKKKNINALLRIYNKYHEQLDNQGRYMHLTKFCDSWIRMEASYKGTYSNQILALLLTLESSEDLSKLIVNKILDKYCFYESTNGEALDVTSDLMKNMGDFPALESLSSRNNDLMATILYLMKDSGFYPLLWKIETIWGIEARNHFIIRLIQEYEANYTPNTDVGIWLSKFGDKLSNLNFKDLLEDAFQIFYQKNNINPKNSAKNNKNDVAD